MKAFRVAALLAIIAGPAYAQQMPHINMMQDAPGKTDEEKAADAERDQRYKETMKKIPDAKTSSDPWGGMRADPPKNAAPKTSVAPKASAAAKKTKTAPTAN
ncbi:hypothetical protein [Bradyrhizobium iriomotense]|uniref:Uncharacterized protein n=1 Tax=Bradyrhizobium iriomotense TaxID=441950 RepID=A0ABQ6BB65_9BRAD|nr:hypothetical protein [Bradyrhizobium iriomotense]GLR90736.1 hypothetical protein GCM10007857_74510 [Bradyrhizobium iriomotense]